MVLQILLAFLAAQLSTAGFMDNNDVVNETCAVPSSSTVTNSTMGNHWLGVSAIYSPCKAVAIRSPTDISATFSSAVTVLTPSGIVSSVSTTVSPVTPFSQITLQKIPNGLTLQRRDHSIVEHGMWPGVINTNMICDAQDLYEKCSSPPYFARCNLDCPRNAFCRVVMAEPYEPCMALCSCSGAVLDEAEIDEFEGLD